MMRMTSVGVERMWYCLFLATLVSGLACDNSRDLALENDGGQSSPDVSADQRSTPDLLSEVDSGAGSEASGVGSPCDTLAVAGPNQGIYNPQALDCPSRICLKPAVQAGASTPVSTTAFCSAECKDDSDCSGQTRDLANALDTRCSTGFTCGIPFVKGTLCCKKLCLCKDFLGSAGATTPDACKGNAALTCSESSG